MSIIEPPKYSGLLLKRKKCISFHKHWVVLSRGYLILYRNKNDAQKDRNRKGTNGLKNAIVKQDSCPSQCCHSSFTIKYGCGGKKHTFYTPADKNGIVKSIELNFTEIQSNENEFDKRKLCSKWIEAIKEHINYWKSDLVPRRLLKGISSTSMEKTLNIDDDDDDTDSIDTENKQHAESKYLPRYIKNRNSLESSQLFVIRSMQNLNLDVVDGENQRLVKHLGPSLPNLQSLNEECENTTSDDLAEKQQGSENELNFDMFSCRSRFSSMLSSSNRYKKFNSNLEKQSEFDSDGWRLRLPAKQLDRSLISIWSIAKYLIGKEIGIISLPVNLCEPLSSLQRIAECFEYSGLLNRASEETSPIRRLELISAHAVSTCSSLGRFTKPFNSILGETYELIRDDLGFKSLSEQVSHHPPVSAFQTESIDPKKSWKCYGEIQPRVKFYANSLGIEIKGLVTVDFPELKETYTWRPSNFIVHNVIVGSLWFEYYGSLEITCHQTGYNSVLNFRPYSRLTKEMNKIDGYIFDDKLAKSRSLFGDWTESLYSCEVASFESYLTRFKRVPNTEGLISTGIKDWKEIWRASLKPDYSNEYYNFSYFAMSLNQLKSELGDEKLPLTDSRFRPDVRELELGNIDRASEEKERLEEKQREAEKNRREPYKGQWFELKKHPYLIDQFTWIFNDKYWLKDYSK